MTATIDTRLPEEHVNWPSAAPMLLIHVLPFLVLFTGITMRAVVLGVVLYFTRAWFITGGYHRYFSHRTYKTSRVMQFLIGFGGTTCAQKGPLWWAAHHRRHHRYSDTASDFHTPRKGFWYSHIGWILSDYTRPTEWDRIPDLAKYPELRWLNRFDWIGPWLVGIASFLIAGLPGLFLGFFGSTVLLWHGTFTVNSLAHVYGRRRYATNDTSRNNWFIALITGGEGWHNNHHHFPASARQGFFWWEIDTTYYGLKMMSWLGLVRDIKKPSKRVKQSERISDGVFDRGMFRDAMDRAARIAHTAEPTIGIDGAAAVNGALDEASETAAALARRGVDDGASGADEVAAVG